MASTVGVGLRGRSTRSRPGKCSWSARAGHSRALPFHLAQLGLARPWLGDFAGTEVAHRGGGERGGSDRQPDRALHRVATAGTAGQGRRGRHRDRRAHSPRPPKGRGWRRTVANWAAAILYNGLARYDEAAVAARHATSDALFPIPIDLGAARARRGGRTRRRHRNSHATHSSSSRRRRNPAAPTARSASRRAAGRCSATARPPTSCIARRSSG